MPTDRPPMTDAEIATLRAAAEAATRPCPVCKGKRRPLVWCSGCAEIRVYFREAANPLAVLRLLDEREAMAAALRPFAACADTYCGRSADMPDDQVVTVSMGQCRAALAGR